MLQQGRLFEFDGARLKTSKGLPLPPHTAGDMLHDAAEAATSAHSLRDQSLSGCDPDRAGSSDINLDLG